MKTTRIPTMVMALVAAGAIACGPADDQFETTDRPVQPTQAELANFQNEVNQALQDIRAELQTMRNQIAEDDPERWAEISTRAERTQAEVQADVNRVTFVDADEARDIRRSASERLAELEAELARRNIEATRDPQQLQASLDEHISSLESNLDEVRQYAMSPGQPAQAEPAPTAQAPGDPAPGQPQVGVGRIQIEDYDEKIADLRVDLAELRAEGQRAQVPDEFEDVRDDVSGTVADLTREVRELWYSARWNLDTT